MPRCVSSLALAASLAMSAPLPCDAAVDLDLSYVDRQSPAYLRFQAWVDQAAAGNPGYAFSATDAAYMYRLSGQSRYATLAV